MHKIFALSLVLTSTVFSATNAGVDSDSLDAALKIENQNANGVVNFNDDVLLKASGVPTQVRAVNSNGDFTFAGRNITVNGNGHTLNGNGENVRGFFAGGDGATLAGGFVTINDLTFSGCQVQGGGSDEGGGGMGAGGGLFVYKNTKATLKDCKFQDCTAKGGSLASGDAGGGMKGNSGALSGSGGGGFGGFGDDDGGGGFGGGGGGSSDFPVGDASGAAPGNNFDGGGAPGSSGVGGASGQPGGFGGGGGAGQKSGFGGGGGSFASGSFGGGGGNFANGGFGGGGGLFGFGGFGGGDGSGTGGAGAGFGGSIFVMDGAELTISGSISFSGSNAVAGSGLDANIDPIAGFGALGKDIFMMSSSSVIFDLTSDYAFANPIEGNQGFMKPDPDIPTTTGGLIKRGPALLSLTGDNTYTGTTTVEEGELRINSSVVSNIEVKGGTLSGTFTAKKDASPGMNGGDITLSSGRIEPGVGGTGTITMEGVYKQTGGTLAVDITPLAGVNDFIMGATSAELAGTLEVIINPGNYIAGTQYTIIDAPVMGEFTNVIETGGIGALIDIQVDYSSVVLTILTTRLFEDQVIDSGPPSDVVKCIRLDDLVPNSDFAIAVESLGTLSDEGVNEALTSLTAIRYGSLEWINARNNSYAADLLSQHVFELCCSPRDCCSCDCNMSAWITVFGNLMDQHSKIDNLAPYEADAVGGLIGIDGCCGPCDFYYGVAFGYTYTDVDFDDKAFEGHTQSYYGALYGSFNVCDCFVTDFSVLGGGTCNEFKRGIDYAEINRTARSDFWSYFATAHLGVRADWCCGCGTFQPFALADYHYFTRETFTEKGANSLNLKVRCEDQSFMRGEAGLRYFYEMQTDCYCFAPYIGASWVGDFPIGKSKQPASFVGQACVIDATSYDSSVQMGAPQAGILWTSCDGMSLLVGYKGLFSDKVRIHEIEGRLEWIF